MPYLPRSFPIINGFLAARDLELKNIFATLYMHYRVAKTHRMPCHYIIIGHFPQKSPIISGS